MLKGTLYFNMYLAKNFGITNINIEFLPLMQLTFLKMGTQNEMSRVGGTN